MPIIRVITALTPDPSTWSQILCRNDVAVMIEDTPDVEELAALDTRESDLL